MAAYTLSYTNFRTRRGFKLHHHTRRFSVQRLRARIVCFFRILTRWRHQTLRAIKRAGICRDDNGEDRFQSCRKGLVVEVENQWSTSGRVKSIARSNSFYTEAIKECLEFIKRNSGSSMEEDTEEEEEDLSIIQNRRISSR